MRLPLEPEGSWSEGAPPRAPGWGLVHLFTGVFVALAAMLLLGSLLPVGSGVVWELIATQAGLGAAALWALWCAREYGGGAAALGFPRGHNLRAAAFGVLALVAFTPLLSGVSLGWRALLERVGIETNQDVLVKLAGLQGAPLALALVLAVVVGPLIEELVFRGFVQQHLVARMGAAPGVIACSLFFGLIHGQAAGVPVFVLSLLLGWVMLRTRRLTAAWAAHSFNNALTLAVVFLVPGGREFLTG